MTATQEYLRLVDLGRNELLNRAAALQAEIATLNQEHHETGIKLHDLKASRDEVLSALKGVQHKEIQQRIDDQKTDEPSEDDQPEATR